MGRHYGGGSIPPFYKTGLPKSGIKPGFNYPSIRGTNMTDNIHQLHPNQDIVEGLRYLIEELEAGKLDRDGECTVVIGSEVFHFGNIHDDQAGANAIFQLTFGVAKLMQAALDDE